MEIQCGQWVRWRNNIIKTASCIMDSNIRSPNSIYMIIHHALWKLYTLQHICLNAVTLKTLSLTVDSHFVKLLEKDNRFLMSVIFVRCASLSLFYSVSNMLKLQSSQSGSRTLLQDKYLILRGLEPASSVPPSTTRSCCYQLPTCDCLESLSFGSCNTVKLADNYCLQWLQEIS